MSAENTLRRVRPTVSFGAILTGNKRVWNTRMRRWSRPPVPPVPAVGMQEVSQINLLPPGSVTAITPTGDRSLAFILCQYFMQSQTVRPNQWIVVDDGRIPIKPIVPMEYVRRVPQRSDPKMTLSINLRTVVNRIRGDFVFIIEDDDYYAPDYIATLAEKLKNVEAVGIGRARYYHLPKGYFYRHGNVGHGSLGSTAFRRSVLPEFRMALAKREDFVDMAFWPLVANRGLVFFDDDNRPLHCSMKAMPGRRGASHGHDERCAYWHSPGTAATNFGKLNTQRPDNSHGDPNYAVLKTWTGEAADAYIGIAQGMFNETNVWETLKRK